LADCRGFQWDDANSDKNWQLHQVTRLEAEQVFFTRPLVAAAARTARSEPRYAAMGETLAGRKLFVVFTIREKLIRVISARDMSRKERARHESARKDAEAAP